MPASISLGSSLHLLANPIRLDGRVAWFNDDTRGFAPLNSYVLTEADEALIVDTGVAAHQEALLTQIGAVVPDPQTQRISVFHTRLGEYNSVGNTAAIIERFPVKTMYGVHNSSRLWVEFRPRSQRRDPHTPTPLDDVEVVVVHGDGDVTVGSAGTRVLRALSAPLKLLPAHWLWDERTSTLFTSDAFSHCWQPTADGPWVITADDDAMTIDAVRAQLLTKFGWLARADTGPTLTALRDVFDRYPVQTIAPSYGCVLSGRAVVERHVDMIATLLTKIG